MKSYSLTRRLIATVLLVELCSTLALVSAAAVYESVSHFRAFDVMLRGRADSMLGAVQDAEDPQDNVMLDGTQAMAPRRDIYAVRDELGRMLGHSKNWPDPLPAFDSNAQYRRICIGHTRYRVIRIEGLRMVDPGDKGGGIPRHVVILYGSPTRPVWHVIQNTIFFYALLSVLLLGASLWVMLRLLRSGLASLNELAVEAGKVSVDAWEFRPTEQARRVKEVAPLVEALETALGGLERSFAQQKQFVNDAAHELKTSVAVVKSSLQVLMMKERDPDAYKTGLQRAEEDCERMEELVASLLTLARLEAEAGGGRGLERVELGDVLAEVTEHLRSLAEMSDVHVVGAVAGEAWVMGERERVRLLISNLMQNALQHSAAGGEVRTFVALTHDVAELRVEDDGEGIAAEALPFVFDRFFRGDVSRSRKTGGTGLGLAISKAIVQGMHGEIRIESEVGHGTRVRVGLPSTPLLEP